MKKITTTIITVAIAVCACSTPRPSPTGAARNNGKTVPLYSFEAQIRPGYYQAVDKPNVFFCLQIEGVGTYLIPEVEQKYDGQQLMYKVNLPNLPPRRKILVHAYDDHAQMNDVIRQMRENPAKFHIESKYDLAVVQVKGNGEIAIPCFPPMRPSHIATGELVITSDSPTWEVVGNLNGLFLYPFQAPIGWIKLRKLE